MPDSERWDVFFSYASPEREVVERLARRTESAGLRVYFDRWRLVAGKPFIPALSEGIRVSNCVAVFIGASGIRPWQNLEWQVGLTRAVTDPAADFRVIPVLLPGARAEDGDSMPDFLKLNTWVDFSRSDLSDPDALAHFIAAIQGEAPGSPREEPDWVQRITLPLGCRPTGIAVDQGHLFVVDHAAGAITRLTDGEPDRVLDGLDAPHHLTVMNSTIIATDTGNGRVLHLDRELTIIEEVSNIGSLNFKRPHGLSSNTPSDYYLSDSDNHRVLKIRGHTLLCSVGRDDLSSGQALGEFDIPCAVLATPTNVYVADTYNHRIVVLSPDLEPIGSFGEFGHDEGQFAYPVGLAVWHSWLFVADEYNKRLQLWRRLPNGIHECLVSKIAGDWIGSPFGLAFDQDGRLWVADRGKGQVLRIDFRLLLTAMTLVQD